MSGTRQLAEPPFRLLPAGDRAVTVEFGSTIDPQTNARVRAMDEAIMADPPSGVVETIPTYRSVQIVYDPVALPFDDLRSWLESLAADGALESAASAPGEARQWIVPVAYGGERGIDLVSAAERLGLAPDDLAERHASAAFTVAMIGFQPGFTYLSGLPEDLHLSRMDTPRTTIPPGSVSIGGVQGAISSVLAPSAWHLLGQTPVRPFDLRRDDPFLFRSGDHLRFRRIDAGEFDRLAALADQGEAIISPEPPREAGGPSRQ